MCQNKIKQRCAKVNSECTEYNRELPIFSNLTDCVTIADTTEEIYNFIGEVKDLLDLSSLESCQSLPITKTPLTIFQNLLDIVCTQQNAIETMQNTIETMQQEIEDLQGNICP